MRSWPSFTRRCSMSDLRMKKLYGTCDTLFTLKAL
jgi:hypothetical protein